VGQDTVTVGGITIPRKSWSSATDTRFTTDTTLSRRYRA